MSDSPIESTKELHESKERKPEMSKKSQQMIEAHERGEHVGRWLSCDLCMASIPSFPPRVALPRGAEPETTLPLKGSVRVWAEIRGALDSFGETHFSADRSMLEHWAGLLAAEISDDLKARLPETLAQIKAIEKAKFVSHTLLNTRIDI